MKNNQTYVWSFLGRLSHWLLVISFFASYITSFYEELLTLHVSFGIFVFGMFLKKIVWGLIGPKYARWSDFDFTLKNLKFYFTEKIENRYREIPAGHNPASSWFAFLVTWIGIFCCLSGFILYGIQEGNGLTSFLNKNYYSLMYIYDDIHIILVYILLAMIFFHISGVLVEQFYHKTNMVMAMVSGYKKAKGTDIKPRFCMVFFGSLYTFFVFILFFYVYFIPDNILIKSKFEKIDYKAMHKDFQFECSDCHNLIPPHLLPKDSWTELMSRQDNHYDEDLNLSKSLAKSIETFLVENSAEKSTREASFKLHEEIKDSKKFTITKTQYWINTHKNIPKEVFKSDKVESKSNCIACHKDFEVGILSDTNITYINNK
ncbi:MAG: cytochrome C [Arcobacter sp.]|nr:MAG: cytochrome C [Arcobacter sp.]